ncbi:hypothetical protein PK98_14880 [Croceibacterium mercuriale]|uniref:Uncharacterized protein n=1 Tax=Croceibacterium mercuriale TaxID=1572751 RepID=A0A0B2BWH1_9SPHN|nr:hypothetical protein PK98_14880 [Croceibacterium mercuriale]
MRNHDLVVKHDALNAWTSLYVGVGLMALLCACLAAAATFVDWRSGRWRPSVATHLDAALLLPKLWIRWQLNYLRGAPVILAVALYYAWSVGLHVFWDL